jgi:hypothetical protein
MISNVITHMCATNGRPTSARPFTIEALVNWQRRSHAYVRNDEKRTQVIALLEKLEEKNVSPMGMFISSFRDVAALLLSEPRYVRNVGAELSDALLGSGAWVQTGVVNESLGYQRPYLRLAAPFPGQFAPFIVPFSDEATTTRSDDGTVATEATVSSDFMDAMATTSMAIDAHRFSPSLIPVATAGEGRKSNEPLWGQVESALAQISAIVSVGLLYRFQAPAFYLRLVHPVWKLARDLALAAYPKERPLIEAYDKLRDEVASRIPLHPLLESIANQLDQVTVSTYYGVKPAVLRDISTTEFMGGKGQDAEAHFQSPLAQAFLGYAAAEYARFSMMKANWPSSWLAGIAPDVTLGYRGAMIQEPAGGISIGALMDSLVKHTTHVTEWQSIARKMGWTGGVPSQAVQIEAAGADAVLCDGDYYSANPISVLMGLRPSFSMGNTRASGITRRVQSDFNSGPNPYTEPKVDDGGIKVAVRQEWSTLAADAYRTATTQADLLAQFYMPPGMLMGEANAEVRSIGPDVPTDPIGRMVLAYYKAKSPNGYVRHWYNVPTEGVTVRDGDALVMFTDWGVTVEGDAELQNRFLTAFGPSNVEQKLQAFVYRDKWLDRIPVRLARTSHIEFYDEVGKFMFDVEFDGHMMFNDVIDLPNDASALNSFRELLTTTAPVLAPPGVNEVQAPEQQQ